MGKNKHSNMFKKLLIWLMMLSLVMLVQPPAYAAETLSAPTVSVKNVSTGVSIAWNKVSGASGYYIYRKNADASYKKIKTVTGTSYTDQSVSSGTTYNYKISAYKGTTTAVSSEKKILHLSTPSVTVSNTTSGIKVSWGKVAGAKNYRIYQKDSGSWTKIADVTGTSYTDASVASGKSRTYTVKAFNGSYTSSYITGKTIMRLSTPSVTVSNTTSGIKVSWDKVSGAKSYRIYQKDSGSWTKIADVTGTSYTDTSVASGKSRTYTVKAFNGSSTSSYITGKTIMRLSTPSVTVSNTTSGIKVSWDKVAGAKSYRIYQKDSGSWTKIADVTGTSYTDASVASGKSRTYTVKAFNGSSTSSYITGKTIMRLSTPSVTVSNTTSGIKVSWGKVAGAKSYRIYQKDSGSWTKIADVTGTSYTDMNVTSGQKRTYTVKAFNGSYTSSYISGKTQMFLDTPEVEFEDSVSGLRIEWQSIEAYTNSTYYYIFREENGKWVELDITEDTLYVAEDAVYGKSETYAVKSAYTDISGVEYFSDYKAFTHTYLYDEKTHTHNWKTSVSYNPTCENEGYEIQICRGCNEEKTVVTEKATGHAWKEISTVNATCVKDGSIMYKCTACNQIKAEIIKAVGTHTWVYAEATDATCYEDGYAFYGCAYCNEIKKEVIETARHHWEDSIETVAVEEEVQVRKDFYRCDGCGEKWYLDGDDDMEALGFWEGHCLDCPEGGITFSKDYEYVTEMDYVFVDTVVGRRCTYCGIEEGI